jgi:hypothetical protein
MTLPTRVMDSLDASPIPLEPADAGARVSAPVAAPYRDPRRSEVPR